MLTLRGFRLRSVLTAPKAILDFRFWILDFGLLRTLLQPDDIFSTIHFLKSFFQMLQADKKMKTLISKRNKKNV
jgi:hypothetical protein